VCAIDSSVNPSPWPVGRIQALCAADSEHPAPSSLDQYILVAQSRLAVVGFIVVSCLPGEGEIQNLGVDTPEQGKGLGLALVQAVLDLLRDRSALRCILEVRESNMEARGLYEKCGFKIDGVRKNYYQTTQGREDAVLMSLDLQASIEKVNE
jgi:[ribosomal protein S18]-alanine N-acetyltransferase